MRNWRWELMCSIRRSPSAIPRIFTPFRPAQTAAGTADIMSHVLEQYFQPCDTAWLTDRLSEEVLKTCIRYCPAALEEPENYEARANLMWASTLGLNHILTAGKGRSLVLPSHGASAQRLL